MSLLIIRLSRLVYSATMMKYASLTKDNDGEGLRVSVFQKSKPDRKPEKQTKKAFQTNTKIQSFLLIFFSTSIIMQHNSTDIQMTRRLFILISGSSHHT